MDTAGSIRINPMPVGQFWAGCRDGYLLFYGGGFVKNPAQPSSPIPAVGGYPRRKVIKIIPVNNHREIGERKKRRFYPLGPALFKITVGNSDRTRFQNQGQE